jgi:plasmid stabilization system protein ParE
MSHIEFHPKAVDEIEAAYDYLFEHADSDTAEAFRTEVESKLSYCHANPLIYRIRRYQVRRANLERFSEHYIAYMLWKDRFIVIALGHSKRRPFYWYRRPKNFRDTDLSS